MQLEKKDRNSALSFSKMKKYLVPSAMLIILLNISGILQGLSAAISLVDRFSSRHSPVITSTLTKTASTTMTAPVTSIAILGSPVGIIETLPPPSKVTTPEPQSTIQSMSTGLPVIYRSWKHEGNASLHYHDDILEIDTNAPFYIYTGNKSLHNYSFSVNTHWENPSENGEAGILIRKAKGCTSYYVRLKPEKTNKITITLLKYTGCSKDDVQTLATGIWIGDISKWNNLQISVSGASQASIIFFINSDMVINYSDDEEFFYFGDVGLRIDNTKIQVRSMAINETR